jgi:hypothetical protein
MRYDARIVSATCRDRETPAREQPFARSTDRRTPSSFTPLYERRTTKRLPWRNLSSRLSARA